MKFAFMQEHVLEWPLLLMARVLGVTRQGYYRWKRREPSVRMRRHQDVIVRMRRIDHRSNGSYGSPRMTQELRADGLRITRKTVERLMRHAGIRAVVRRRFRPTTDSSKTLAPAPNLLQRQFAVSQLNRVWVSDFTELPCRDGKAYAVGIMDLASRRILGINVHYRMHTGSLMIAFHRACKLRRTFPNQHEPTIFHSDRGGQYNAEPFRQLLRSRGFRQSMSGVGNCYEQA